MIDELKNALKEIGISYDTIKKIGNRKLFSIDDNKYIARFMNDGRIVVLEVGVEAFPPRVAKNSASTFNDIFTNIAKFALKKWVVKDSFVKFWPENVIDPKTGDVLPSGDYFY